MGYIWAHVRHQIGAQMGLQEAHIGQLGAQMGLLGAQIGSLQSKLGQLRAQMDQQ